MNSVELRGAWRDQIALISLVMTLPEFLHKSVTRCLITWRNTCPVHIHFNMDGAVIVHNNTSLTQISFKGMILTN